MYVSCPNLICWFFNSHRSTERTGWQVSHPTLPIFSSFFSSSCCIHLHWHFSSVYVTSLYLLLGTQFWLTEFPPWNFIPKWWHRHTTFCLDCPLSNDLRRVFRSPQLDTSRPSLATVALSTQILLGGSVCERSRLRAYDSGFIAGCTCRRVGESDHESCMLKCVLLPWNHHTESAHDSCLDSVKIITTEMFLFCLRSLPGLGCLWLVLFGPRFASDVSGW